ncbi:hypothetical protein B0J13DRAFT_630231 [Dactylonectria estremocensis]|uniref:DUF6536 domain-containing protein n=1 Tax=Dactylonectria estremocensis TaxID=1079267 RepID=A0A9P9IEL3_9HYPO|nr:hypothetical protein B0J13DRAFT_630231 [Dactylonectria estremocensis]
MILHVGLNAIAALALASSNLFMQLLCSPTRANVDEAHRRGHSLEIGVQSIKNLWFLSAPKIVLWLMLGASSVPLHLFFNASVTESKASTDFQVIIASESFLNGVPFSAPGAGAARYRLLPMDLLNYNEFLDEIAANATEWKKMDLQKCLSIYDSLGKSLSAYRQLVMVAYNEGEAKTKGWNTTAMIDFEWSDFDDASTGTGLLNETNSIWLVKSFERTDESVGKRHNNQAQMDPEDFAEHDKNDWVHYRIGLDSDTGFITPDKSFFSLSVPRLEVDYCLSEPFVAPCEVLVQNNTLLVVCIFCLAKSVFCLASIIRFRRYNPLITPGDAVESFITRPDPTTKNICWVTRRPKPFKKPSHRLAWFGSRSWAQGPRQWKTKPRRLGSVVPWEIWIGSYLYICYMLGVAIWHLDEWWLSQP